MIHEITHNIPSHVSKCLQLAMLLEVSAYPKPGNVHRTMDFRVTRYEHFLASAVALAPHFQHAAEQGMNAFNKKSMLSQICIGKIIRNAVADVAAWQRGGNTVLGSIILLAPMATAAGLTIAENPLFCISRFRRNLRSVVESAAAKDAMDVYDAISLAEPGGLGKVPRLDVTDAKSKKQILEQDVNLFEIFKISSTWDSISAEWVTNYYVTFDIGYPFFKRQLKETCDINTATVHTYLKVLAEIPDTLIIRKAGADKARWVSTQAQQILNAGGLTTQRGKKGLLRLDRKLHDRNHKLNPGTTADITSAILSIATLGGYRP